MNNIPQDIHNLCYQTEWNHFSGNCAIFRENSIMALKVCKTVYVCCKKCITLNIYSRKLSIYCLTGFALHSFSLWCIQVCHFKHWILPGRGIFHLLYQIKFFHIHLSSLWQLVQFSFKQELLCTKKHQMSMF